ncbi:MAG: hypothetical protein JXR96_19135 [Deltaproteobacteria bacterium]|nr:hypothetical protein [Deltaproteobacteria bacterium]
MASSSRTSTATRKDFLRKHSRDLDRLSTREAQVIRMRYGIDEPPDSAVGRPARSIGTDAREELEALEDELIERLRDAHPGERDGKKQKILEALKKKS